MFGTFSTNLTELQEIFSDGVLQIPSTTLCNPIQFQTQHSQTTSGVELKRLDRETGDTITIQYSSFNLSISDSTLSFNADWQKVSPQKLILLLKCLLILQELPDVALDEASDELEGIFNFYSSRPNQVTSPTVSALTIKGKLRDTQTRPPIVLEP